MMVLAPMGAGKGRGIVVPNLLEHPGSVICLDPKGENFAVTAADRVKRGKVFLLSMDPSVPSHSFNPMDTIGPSIAEKAAGILADLMLPHGVTQDSHCPPAARASSQLARAATKEPACSGPVGEGAKRPL